jgi:uncharacterized membrane protein YkvA (DUF1232 family)
MTATTAFPRDRFLALVRRLPAYARLGWRLSRDPHLSRGRRSAVAAAVAYVVSPIDVVPGFIPLAGQLDDAAVALLGLRLALGGLPAAERQAHLAASGLEAADLDEDLRTVRAGAGWMLRQGGRIGLQGVKAGVRMVVRGIRGAAGRRA